MGILGRVDRRLSRGLETTARRLNRREVLYNGVKLVTGATAAASVGDLAFAASPALAASLLYTCCDPYSGACGTNERANSCPSGWSTCTRSNCGCVYSGGTWVSTTCSPCAHGSGSYRICRDCYKQGSGCATLCTIVSYCECTGCGTPAEVKAEMAKMEHVAG